MDLAIDKWVVFDKDTAAVMPFSPVLVDPKEQSSIDAMFTEAVELPQYIPPKVRFLLSTQEAVQMQVEACGLIALRSTWARLGLIAPPTIVDPGFRGTLTMEVYNASNHRLLLRPGDRVFSMVRLVLVAKSEPPYSGRYQGQGGLQIPKAMQGVSGAVRVESVEEAKGFV